MDEMIAAALSAKRECAFCNEEKFGNGDLINGTKGVMICKRCVTSIAQIVAMDPHPPSRSSATVAVTNQQVPKLVDLVRVVAAGQTATVDGVSVTLLSIELYDDGFIINGRVRRSIPSSSDEGVHWLPALDTGTELRAADGHGGVYASLGMGGGGDAKEYRLHQTFSPALALNASELRIELANLRYVRFDPRAPDDRSRDELKHGPWSFVIPLAPA
jgi:hypothetical protein